MDTKDARPVTRNSLWLSDRQFGERLGVCRTTIWRRARTEPDFPQPVKLSRGCSRWRLADIDLWEAMRLANVA